MVWRIPVILLFLVTSLWAGEFRFSALENGDHIELTEESTGCFHHTRSYYEVRKMGGLVLFAVFDVTWNKERPGKVAEKKLRREIELGRKDLEGLDKLLAFYRREKELFSTTQVSLQLVRFRDGRRVGQEKLRDQSGGHGLGEHKDILTLAELARRADEE